MAEKVFGQFSEFMSIWYLGTISKIGLMTGKAFLRGCHILAI
jgi:hypothetical protein